MNKDDKSALVIGISLMILIITLLITISTQQTRIRILREELNDSRVKNEQLMLNNKEEYTTTVDTIGDSIIQSIQ